MLAAASCTSCWALATWSDHLRAVAQGNVALLNNRGDGGMPFGHILAYKADSDLQIKFLDELDQHLVTTKVDVEESEGAFEPPRDQGYPTTPEQVGLVMDASEIERQ